MQVPRKFPAAALLSTGEVLFAGGVGDNGPTLVAELFDPFTWNFRRMGSTLAAHADARATVLRNGRVLIVGGATAAELYDPESGTFSLTTGGMVTPRSLPTCTLLSDGRVLIAGGALASGTILNSVEVYDPQTGLFTPTGSMLSSRANHAATLLPNGRVLITGGSSGSDPYLNSAELYDPQLGQFMSAGNMTVVRSVHTATLLPNGRVLIAGGYIPAGITNTAELYDPATGAFTPTGNLTGTRAGHTATLRPDGKVLLVGGAPMNPLNARSSDLYDPATGAFTADAWMPFGVDDGFTTTQLADGRTLVVGESNYMTKGYLYTQVSGTFHRTGDMSVARYNFTATPLPNGRVLIAGGFTDVLELYDPATGSYSVAGNMSTSRVRATATLLADGRVLIAGGMSAASLPLASAEIYDPETNSIVMTGSLRHARYGHTATLLANGMVLVTGTSVNETGTTSAELYDPAKGQFVDTGSMTVPRMKHGAILLRNGNVLIAGGFFDSAEIYHPDTGAFSATSGAMWLQRSDYPAMTLLTNGNVLITGGSLDSGYSEVFDPQTSRFTLMPRTAIRAQASATLLADGRVLITGGYVRGGAAQPGAELFDTRDKVFITTASVPLARWGNASVLLPDGKVLIAGGWSAGALSESEIYDPGFGAADSRRPVITNSTGICQPDSISLSGTGFMSDSEGAGGGRNSSANNTPLLRLQRVDNGDLRFAPVSSFSQTSFTSNSLADFATGMYRATIVSNGIPSLERMIRIGTPPQLWTYPATLQIGEHGTNNWLGPLSGPSGSQALNFPVTVSASPGFEGSLSINGNGPGIISVVNAAPAGTYTITVGSHGTCGDATSSFSLEVVPVASLTDVYGDGQRVLIGRKFAIPIGFIARDSNGKPLTGVAVSVETPQSGPSAVIESSFLTDWVTGFCHIYATANGIAGSYTVTAHVGALSLDFHLTNLDYTMVVSGGTPQRAVVTKAFATPLQVAVNDTDGNPVGGAVVTFSSPNLGASATLSSSTPTTNASGIASVTATANNAPGTYVVTAHVGSLSVDFHLTNLDYMMVVSGGTPQTAVVTKTFATPLQVAVSDTDGNHVSGAVVTFSAPTVGASATLSSSTATTDASGIASVTATAKSAPGSYVVTARVGSLSVDFHLTNLDYTMVASGGTPQTAEVTRAFPAPLQILLKDSDGNPVSGIVVTFFAPASGASATLSSTTAATNASGIASVTATANANIGSYVVTATVGQRVVQFAMTNVPNSMWKSDYDGNGRSEIMLERFGPHQLYYIHMRSDGMWYDSASVVSSPNFSSNTVGSGDVDGDGKSDVFFQDPSTGAIAFWLMSGSSVRSTIDITVNPGVDWQVASVGDFDADGHADIALQNTNSGDVVMWWLDGNGLRRRVFIGSPGFDWKVVGAGDFNGDRNGDLVLQNLLTGDVAVWLLNGDTILSGVVIGTPGVEWNVAGIGDFNGDHKADVILQNTLNGDVAEWLLDGTTITEGSIIGTPGPNWKVVGTGDYNGDGVSHVLLLGGESVYEDHYLAQWQVKDGQVVAATSGLYVLHVDQSILVVN